MQQEQFFDEIKQISCDRLDGTYDLIRYFCLGLKHGADTSPKQHPTGLANEILQIPASFFGRLPDDILDSFGGK